MRDALLFRLVFETGLRISEALGAHVEDLDLTRGDEHLTVLGKGERKRTVLLDDPRLVNLLRRYPRTLGYTHWLLFQATKNGRGGPLRYQSVQERWQGYAEEAGVKCTSHQLRHSHATELVNGGVSLATIRKRLGHQQIQTTLRYAEVNDTTADAEVRRWRRGRRLYRRAVGQVAAPRGRQRLPLTREVGAGTQHAGSRPGTTWSNPVGTSASSPTSSRGGNGVRRLAPPPQHPSGGRTRTARRSR